ncbi:hypothetical protein [Actinomadura sediminis]|uniref:Peptidase M15B domain-containing protein n=1 Tax=Actinomadura sediminis TaxID=1038904 RepID=A0ABW3EIP4_9ACTN
MTRLPHDPHPHARVPDPSGAFRAADRRKPGRLDPRRPVPRLLALGAGALLAATAVIVTTSATATAAPAAPAARAIPDGPPVPSDDPPLPMGRPHEPVFPGTDPGSGPEAPHTLEPAPGSPPGSLAAPAGQGSTVEALQPSAKDAPEAKDDRPVRPAEPAGASAPAANGAPPVREPAAGPGKPDLPPLPKAMRLEHDFVTDVLRARDIEWRSTGNCSDREKPTCTSFTGLRWTTLEGLLRFAAKSGCKIVVTGGTERGHAPGRHSHYNGYKIDIAPNKCVDREIEGYDREGVRGDGAKLYRSPEGGLYARESDHWDITYT